MALNKNKLILDLTLFFSDLSPTATAATKAASLATIIDDFVKTGEIAIGSLSSNGSNSAGPVNSTNTTGGTIE